MKLAIVDLDGVVANSDARFAKATVNGKINWKIAFDPTLVELDTLIDGVHASLEELEWQGYNVIFLSSRPEPMKDATIEWLDKHGLFEDGYKRSLELKPLDKQFTKTKEWKAKKVLELAREHEATEILFIDDEPDNAAELMNAGVEDIAISVWSSLKYAK
jgi:phosphoglycolate phosphatase-like HAD superfamily hydrolase